MQQNTFEKNWNSRGMLIEQIFELKGPGPPGRICTPISVPTKPIFFSKSVICWSKGKYFWAI